jgi:hypothetical protein
MREDVVSEQIRRKTIGDWRRPFPAVIVAFVSGMTNASQ